MPNQQSGLFSSKFMTIFLITKQKNWILGHMLSWFQTYRRRGFTQKRTQQFRHRGITQKKEYYILFV